MTTPTLAPSDLLKRMEVPNHRGVFSLGNFARQVTFASQQTRAFNLIWALCEDHRLAAGSQVAVVGAGLAGLTAAAAALAKQCRVDLYEQASQPFPLQRGNDIRFIHPNILRWPEPGSEGAHTDLPLLNWTAANVRSVIRQIEIQWRRSSRSDQLSKFFNYKVSRIHATTNEVDRTRPWLVANRVVDGSAPGEDMPASGKGPLSGATGRGYVERSYDAIILAVGFGEERAVDGVPFFSYWENDSLHQEVGTRGRRSILVSGCGDGGLIDALRLRLRNFDHAEFVRLFQAAGDSTRMIEQLTQIERDLRAHARAIDISVRFQTAYDAVPVPKDVEDYFRRERRADTTVTLNSPEPGPLSYKSSLLNRYATYLALRHADLRYLSGRVVTERASPGHYEVILERGSPGLREGRAFDLVVVRHGPQSVIDALVPPDSLATLRTAWADAEDLTTQPWWRSSDASKPHAFFVEARVEEPVSREDEIGLARVAFDSAFDRYSRDPYVESVAIATESGRSGFVVSLNAVAPPRPDERYAGVSVHFVRASSSSPPKPQVVTTTLIPGTSTRNVPVAAGLYNYDARAREQSSVLAKGREPNEGDAGTNVERSGLSTSLAGTLGCFATDANGNTFLVSAAHVLDPLGERQIGDRIFLDGESPELGNLPIATLDRVVLASSDTIARADVAAAKLTATSHADYSPFTRYGLKLVDFGDAVWDQRLFKLAPRVGVSVGYVRTTHMSIRVLMSDSRSVIFSDCFEISGSDDESFLKPGDSGAIAVTDDGLGVGMVFAGRGVSGSGDSAAVAFSLRQAFAALDLKLLPFRPPEMDGTPVKPRRKKTTRRKRA